MGTPPAEPARDAEAAATPAERRLAESRAALAQLLAPPRDDDEFPRSETMRFVLGGKGRMIAFGLFVGLFLVKPKIALGLVRFLPVGKLLPVQRILQALR